MEKKKRNKPTSLLKLPKFMAVMTPEQVAVVDSHLLVDSPIEPLMKIIQDQWGHSTDLTLGSLQRALYRYKDRFILPKQTRVAAKISSPEVAIKIAALQTHLDNVLNPVKALEQIISHQIDRVNKLREVEEIMPTLMDSQTKNIQVLSEMLFKLASVHMDVGIIRKVPHKHEVDISPEQQAFLSSLKTGKINKEVTVEVLQLLHETGHLVSDSVEIER